LGKLIVLKRRENERSTMDGEKRGRGEKIRPSSFILPNHRAPSVLCVSRRVPPKEWKVKLTWKEMARDTQEPSDGKDPKDCHQCQHLPHPLLLLSISPRDGWNIS
jgi:hypothetical protein